MNTPLASNERVVKEGPANLQRGPETVGGHLYLTNLRLVFEPHAMNVQKDLEVIDLSAVVRTYPCWTKFLGVFPLANNSLAVVTRGGQEHRFVCFNRKAWADSIATSLARPQ